MKKLEIPAKIYKQMLAQSRAVAPIEAFGILDKFCRTGSGDFGSEKQR
jgi:hypothetical protein